MQLESSVTLFDDTKVETRFAELQITADGITSEVSKKVGNDEVISRINQTAETIKIQADKVNIEGATIFTSGRLSESSLNSTYDANGAASTALNEAKDYADGATSGKANKTDAVARQQRIYYRKTFAGAPSKNTTWLSTSGTGYGNWSLKIPQMTSGTTKYPYLYTAVQTQTVSQASGSACSCSDVLLDDTTTVIDGGTIITGTVNANAVNANSGTFNTANIPDLSASKINSGTISVGVLPSDALNSTYITDIGSDGIRVHDSHTSNNSIVINSAGMEVFKGGTSNAYSVAKYGDTARIGKNANNASHVSILNDGVHIWNGVETTASNEVASFGASEINLGKNSSSSEIKLCGENGTIKAYNNHGLYFGSNQFYAETDFTGDSRSVFSLTNNHAEMGTYPLGDGCYIATDINEDDEATIWMGADWIELDRGSIYMMDGNAPAKASLTANAIWSKNTHGNYRLCQPSSSSRRYKEDIKPVEDDRLDPHRLYDISVVQFKFKKGYFEPDDPYEQDRKDVIGFIAEDVYEHYPQAVIMMDDEVENWNERYIIPPMLKLIQEQKKKIDELEGRIEALERTNK